MTPHNDPQSGSDLLMHLTIPSNMVGKEFYQDIKLLHTELCPSCGGSGNGCLNCHDLGHIRVLRIVEVKIPSKLKEGMRLRLQGLGESGDIGANSGDLFLEIHFRSHFYLTLENLLNFLRRLFLKKRIEENLPIIIPSKKTSDDTIIKDMHIDAEDIQIGPSENTIVCSGQCKKKYSKKNMIQCGPCYEESGQKKLYCRECWKNHQWVHGKAPRIGIEYHSNGSFSGFDGSEQNK